MGAGAQHALPGAPRHRPAVDARGAGIGAMRGAASGDPGEGALHGAGMGRLLAVMRSRRQMEKQKQQTSTKDSELHAQLEKYDGAYTACLTERGYTVK